MGIRGMNYHQFCHLRPEKILQIYFPEVGVLQPSQESKKQITAFLGYEIFSDKDAAYCLQMFFTVRICYLIFKQCQRINHMAEGKFKNFISQQ